MQIITDTSAILAVILNEPERKSIIQITKGFELIAPGAIHWKLGNACSAMLKKKRITLKEATKIIHIYQKIPIRRIEIGLEDSLKIASIYNIYAYDAYFIISAKSYNLPLLSLDKRLIDVAKKEGIKLMEVK